MKIPYNVNLDPEQNKNIAIEAVTANGANLLDVDKRYRNDEQVVRAALAHNGPFDKVSDRLKRDQNIALIAVRNNPYAFKHHVIALSENLGYEDVETFLTELEGPILTELGGRNKDNLLAVQVAAIEAGRIGVRQPCIVKTQGNYMVDVEAMKKRSYRSRVAKIAFNQDLGNRRSGIFKDEAKKLVPESYLDDRRFGGALLQLCVDRVVNYKDYNDALSNNNQRTTYINSDTYLTVALNNNSALIYRFTTEGFVEPFYSNDDGEKAITRDQSRAFLSTIVRNRPDHIFNQEIINEILTPQRPNALVQPIVNNPVIEIVNNLEQQTRVDAHQIRKQVKIEVDDKIIDESKNQIENPGTRVEPKVYQRIDKSQNQNQGRGN